MKNKKILKMLAALSIGAVMAAGSLSLAACGGHKHAFDGKWYADGAKGHYQLCTGCEDGKSTVEAHDNSADTTVECSKCGWKTTPAQSGGNEEDPNNPPQGGGEEEDPNKPPQGGGEEDPNPPATAETKEIVKVNVGDLTTVAAGGELATGITAVKALTIEDDLDTDNETAKYSIKYDGNTVATPKRIKFGGAVQTGDNSLKLAITEKSIVVVYARSGAANADRGIRLLDSEGKTVSNQPIGDGSAIGTAIFKDVEAGTYYVGSQSGSMYVYYVAILSSINEVKTPVAAVSANCTDTGIVAHTTTSFGRYLNSKDEAISVTATIEAAKGHDYEHGTVTVTKIPEVSEKGSATVTCGVDSTHAIGNIELPVLKSDKYSKSGQSGTVTYSYTAKVDGKNVAVTFEAGYEEAVASNITKVIMYFNADGKSTTVQTWNGSAWEEDASIITASDVYKTSTGTAASNYKSKMVANSKFDNGTTDNAADDIYTISDSNSASITAVAQVIKMEGATRIEFTLAKKAKITVHYTNKAASSAANVVCTPASGSAVTIACPGLTTAYTLGASAATTLEAGSYTVTRSAEIGIAFLEFELA